MPKCTIEWVSATTLSGGLGKALKLAAPGGYVRCFLDEGGEVLEMLHKEFNLKTAVGRLEVAAFCDFARSGCVSLARDVAAGATIDL
jgi:hypothetical protein